MPKVSVIVAVYNVAPYLKRSMDCLMNQTLKDIEFICIDDCSTDSSLSILKEYAEKDSRFKIISSEKIFVNKKQEKNLLLSVFTVLRECQRTPLEFQYTRPRLA